jgi:thymidine kinase
VTVDSTPPEHMPGDFGWIEVITGCMFSGKTEELIRRLRRAQYARQAVIVFKPGVDNRYADDAIGSHVGRQLRSINVAGSSEILRRTGGARVVGIDEAQFFDDGLVDVTEHLAGEGRRVIVAGLDTDYLGRPFGPMPELLCKAEYISKYLAICVVCGAPADRSQRVVNREKLVLVGATDAYEARCRRHWDPACFDPVQQTLPLGPNLADALEEG